jgi:hypothetical protein
MMKKLLYTLLLLCVVNQINSQTHTYQFNGAFTPSGAGPTLTEALDPTCVPAGTNGSFTSQIIVTSGCTRGPQSVFSFNQNAGVSYPNPSFITGTYTINILYSITNYNTGAFTYQKVLDFSNGASDNGLYTNYNGGSPTFATVTGPNGSPTATNITLGTPLVAGQFYLVTLVRNNATNLLDIYLDGNLILGGYDDTAGDYLLASSTTPIIFFRDDVTAAFPCESAAGAVRLISLQASVSNAAQVAATYTSLCFSVLPVNLSDFSAQKNNTNVLLQWKTSTEVNTSYFEVERSYDGKTFNAINKVNGSNTGIYIYNDINGLSLSSANTYYRLKMFDANGKFKYSSIVRVSNGKEILLSVFPNPATDVITISGLNNKDVIRVLSVDGKVLLQQTANVQSMIMSIEKYKPGTYILQVQNDKNVTQQKFIKY